jgi:hypothetical protein
VTWPPEPPADSDHETVDRWRDDLAVQDPYEEDFEPVYSHGPILPPDVTASFAVMPPSPIQAGRSRDAGEDPSASPARGPLDVSAPAMPGRGA